MIYLDGIIYSIQKFGGISTYFSELMSGYDRRNLNFKLLYYSDNIPLEYINPQIVKRKPRLLERYRNLKDITGHSIFHSSYYRHASPPDVINIITVYDFCYEKFNIKFKKEIHRFYKSSAIKHADAIICISNSTKRDLLTLYPFVREENIFVTHLAASDHYFPIEGYNNSRFTNPSVLFVGSRDLYKNFISVVIGLEMIPGIKLTIVGGGNLSPVELKILNRLLPNRYEYRGNVSSSKLNELYNNSICLVYPSKYEGFGIPLLEAMSAGCPVVAVRSSSIPEVVGDASLLLDIGNPDEIKAAILKLLDPSYNSYYKELGKLQTLKFSWDKTVEQTVKIYDKFL